MIPSPARAGDFRFLGWRRGFCCAAARRDAPIRRSTPKDAHGESLWWLSSTVLLTALGFYMWPHTFASIYTAKGAKVIRKNAIMLPLYQLILLFVFFVGFAATLQLPGLIDLALFKLSAKTVDSGSSA